jgi:MFS transporter, FSR family, fosmidomycin resistance protein
MKAVYILAWVIALNYLAVLATPAENALLARYTPARWRATAYGAKFLLALGVSTIGVKLVAVTYDATGNFAALWLVLGGCAGLVALAAIFLPGRLQPEPLPTPQPAE